MYRYVINQTYARMLQSMLGKQVTILDLAKQTGMSYQHLANVVQQFHKEGLMARNPKRPHDGISLSKKGQAIVIAISHLTAAIEAPSQTEAETQDDTKAGPKNNRQPAIRTAQEDVEH